MSQRTSNVYRMLPVIGWARGYRRNDLRPDLLAGLTAGAMLVPQGMVYAQLAGLPAQVGLYAATVPLLVYALVGTSRQLSVGPVAVISLLTATALGPIAEGDPVRYAQAAAMLAVLVGVFSIGLGLARMGWVTNLLSHPVLVGFTAASAVIIAVGQLKHLLGVKIPRTDGFLDTSRELFSVIGETKPLTVLIGSVALVALLVLKRWRKTFPAALVLALGGVVVSNVADLADQGVAVVGDIPGGLPSFVLPTLGGLQLGDLIAPAILIAVIGYVESVAVGKVYARRNRYEIDPNQELIALGASNLAAGFFQGQPVTGGFSRTAVNADAGARTPLASIVTAAFIGLVLLLFTGVFTQLPQAILGAIVIAAVIGLIDIKEARHIAAVKRPDAVSLAVAFVATLFVGVELGIAIAAVFSIVLIIARLMNPHSAELGRIPGTDLYRNLDRFSDAEPVEGIGILRIDVSLNFANAAYLKRRLRSLAADHGGGLRHIVLDASGINDLDTTGEASLAELIDEFDAASTTIHLASLKGPVRDVLIRSGLWHRLGDRIHPSVASAMHVIEDHPDCERRNTGLDERRRPDVKAVPTSSANIGESRPG